MSSADRFRPRIRPSARGRLRWLACIPVLAGLTACAGGASRPALSSAGSHAASVECAPYARAVSGIQLYGDAASWWEGAAGRYERGSAPAPGSVLVFERSRRLPAGHVSVVAGLRTPREITVTQANWVHGRISSGEPVVDVSPGNDWSAVRVWWEPSGQLGTTVYPTFGFIGPGPATRSDRVAASDPLP